MSPAQPAAIRVHAAAAFTTHRWPIATAIDDVGRQALDALAPGLQRAIGGSEIPYSNIADAVQGTFAIGLLLAGRFLDRSATRAGYASAQNNGDDGEGHRYMPVFLLAGSVCLAAMLFLHILAPRVEPAAIEV